MDGLPQVTFAHIGGSGTWGFRYPDGALDGHPYLSARVVEADIRTDVPRYRVFVDGQQVSEPTDVSRWWRDDP